jgi:histo-blood group ABO system transferase
MIKFFLACILGCSIFVRGEESAPLEKDKKHNVALCVVGTGKYAAFAKQLIASAKAHFLTRHNVTYVVFSDGDFSDIPNVVKVHKVREGWPLDTLKRFHAYDEQRELLDKFDYIFAIDADMEIAGPVGDEILDDLVGTQHPGFVGKKGTYEKDKKSTAYVAPSEGKTYFCGGFYGGKKGEFFKLLKRVKQQVDADLARNYIAKWHDESHLNRYFIDHPPSRVLSPAYCYPESWKMEYPKKIVALDKNHAEARR